MTTPQVLPPSAVLQRTVDRHRHVITSLTRVGAYPCKETLRLYREEVYALEHAITLCEAQEA